MTPNTCIQGELLALRKADTAQNLTLGLGRVDQYLFVSTLAFRVSRALVSYTTSPVQPTI
jgi:hypothetical protein